jgi:CRP-like cAMP-binding protein
LKKTPLFSKLSEVELLKMLIHSEIYSFSLGDKISSKSGERSVKIILEGRASVTKSIGDKELLMRIASPGSVLGVASLFTDTDTEISRITALKKTTVFFVNGTQIQRLIHSNGDFAEQYIRLLTSKARFLNNRVKAYTSGSAEARLAFHIAMLDENKTGRVATGLSKTKLADMLDIGRASLYRAIDNLTEKKIIKYEKNEIIILDYEALLLVADGKI